MEEVISRVVQVAVSAIIGAFLVDLAAQVFLGISIVEGIKDMLSKIGSKRRRSNEDTK